ncbi:MAG TPA: hypothetical protein VNB49_03870 [Candidatus Dormibacteraeota bacterium]|nr:hypothetical protein [Candidatus Dormibacteraeota bacterium]
MELPAQEEESSEKAAETVPQEKAQTCEVWFGNDESLGKFVQSALKENGILTRIERQGTEVSIYAPPGEEASAKEIVREIVEGTPTGRGEQR